MSTSVFGLSVVSCLAILLMARLARRQKEQLTLDRQAIDMTTHGMLFISTRGRVLGVSRMAEKTFMTDARAFIGNDIRRFITPADQRYKLDAGCEYLRVNSGLVGHTSGGESFPMTVRTCSGWYSGKAAIAVIIQDESRKRHLSSSVRQYADQLKLAKDSLETQNRQLEDIVRRRTAELESAKETAERANEIKGAFLANVSHELRTPLHGILSFSRFGIRKTGDVPLSKVVHYFQRIEESGTTLLCLIDELLDLAKLESGTISLELAPTDLSEAVTNVVESFSGICKDRRIDFETQVYDELTHVVADQRRVEQVLRNLLSNAIRFAPEDSTVSIVLDQTEHAVTVSICDEGPGIPDDELHTIFEKFIQSSRTMNSSGGTGLGLAICQEIVELHNGVIRAANRPQRGAEFTFALPISTVSDSSNSNLPNIVPVGVPNETHHTCCR